MLPPTMFSQRSLQDIAQLFVDLKSYDEIIDFFRALQRKGISEGKTKRQFVMPILTDITLDVPGFNGILLVLQRLCDPFEYPTAAKAEAVRGQVNDLLARYGFRFDADLRCRDADGHALALALELPPAAPVATASVAPPSATPASVFVAPSDGRPAPIEITDSLARFRQQYPDAARTAFIMMPFHTTAPYPALAAAIKTTLAQHGIAGLRADDHRFHALTYYNILTYLHGCGFGVMVADRIASEQFNPNVALEAGYLLGLGKPLCCLKDQTLPKLFTDLAAQLYTPFDPHAIPHSVAAALTAWLAGR